MTESRWKSLRWYSVRAALSVLVAGLIVLAAPAHAVSVPGLYYAEVPVADSASGALQQGYRDGLRQVLVRVSGSEEVLSLDGIDQVLAEAESLLQGYQVGSEDGQARLQMSFGAVGVNRALASVGAPVWGANRPLTLAWVAVEDRGSRNLLVSGDDRELWREAFEIAARVRGLPVAFPSGEHAGNRSLMSDLWGQFVGRIEQASEDIAYDVLALVRVSRSGGHWRAGWVIDGMGMDAAERSVTADTPENLARAVVDHWAEQYARRYAVAAGDVGEAPGVDVVFEGVSTVADYAGVIGVLEELTPVDSVSATRVRGERLTMRIAFTGELEQLKEYMALDPRFVPVAAGPEVEASTDEHDAEQAFEALYQVLYYRWQPTPVVRSGGDNE
ncbi:MAG TPA: DUF2066 domain-containing protein [Marinobacter sp.]|nr:DUF2066 domain-containing protein [Marinobacter sp.]